MRYAYGNSRVARIDIWKPTVEYELRIRTKPNAAEISVNRGFGAIENRFLAKAENRLQRRLAGLDNQIASGAIHCCTFTDGNNDSGLGRVSFLQHPGDGMLRADRRIGTFVLPLIAAPQHQLNLLRNRFLGAFFKDTVRGRYQQHRQKCRNHGQVFYKPERDWKKVFHRPKKRFRYSLGKD